MNTNSDRVVLVKDINPVISSNPTELFEFDDKLYFAADDGETGNELWVSDGTSEGTNIVADIRPGSIEAYPYSSNPSDFIEFNDKLYFFIGNDDIDSELWVSDGTSEGTNLVADINPGDIGSYFFKSSFFNRSLVEFNDKLYFSANDGETGTELWVSDGTSEGTSLLADINPDIGSNPFSFAYRAYSYGSNPSSFIEFNDKLYFSANDGENGEELWVSDGTSEGTNLVADINPGSYPSYPGSYPSNPRGYSSNPSYFIEFNDKLYFAANDKNRRELWVSDGTSEGTNLVADINPGNYPSNPSNFIEFNNKLYFRANDGENGTELWVSDGTSKGTNLVADINPGRYSFYPNNFFEFNDKLYFSANDGENGNELWVSDGTSEGTNLVADIRPGSLYYYPYGSFVGNFIEFNDKLYFTARDDENVTELWVTDGTSEGTNIVTDINSASDSRYFNDYPLNELTVFRDELFFTAPDDEVGRELFKLTASGTVTQTQALNPIAGTPNNDNLVGTDGDDEIRDDGSNDGITGSSGSDVLEGRGGNDALDGGAGDDTLDGGTGTDTAVYQFAPAAVTVTLGEAEAAGTASDGFGDTDSLLRVENVIGSDGDDNLTGNSGNNSLTGRDGNDVILGSGGDDSIVGSIGADILTGGEGSDQFIYLNSSEGVDIITDFAVGTDKITAVAAGFGGGLSAGVLSESSFTLGSAATTSDQRFIFDESSNELFFDTDGDGDATQQLIATFDGVSNLSAGDIMLL